jgi:predicted Zn-dependent protease with MMP-like domain
MGSALSDPRERFETLVVEAMDGLPAWVHERLENVEVLIEDEPPPGQPNLLGRYEGIPLTRRGSNYFGVLPDRITLYRRTIEGAARRGRTDLREVVRHTVIHEVAHFFGISDERLHELDRY